MSCSEREWLTNFFTKDDDNGFVFMLLSTLFKSYRDDGRVIMKGSML